MRPPLIILWLLLALTPTLRAQTPFEVVDARPAWASAPRLLDGRVLIPLIPSNGATDPVQAMARPWAPASSATSLPGTTRRLIARATATSTAPGADWIGTGIVWEEPSAEEPASTPALWMLEFRPDAGVDTIEVNGRTVALFDAPPHFRVRGAPEGDVVFNGAIAPVAADPSRRWRAVWLGVEGAGTIDDPLARAWSEAITARWDEAARRLAGADVRVVQRVAERLVAIADPAGAALPMWSLEPSLENTLLTELLDARADRAALIGAGEAWLVRSAPVVCWIADDAPPTLTGKLPGVSVGVVSLALLPVTPALASDRGPARLTPTIEAGPNPVEIALPMNTELPSDIVTVRLGAWEARLGALTAPLAALPPGLSTGPFFYDHTRASFGVDRAPPVRTQRTTRAVLIRLEPGVWQVVVECATDGPPGGGVTLWLGARDAGIATRVTPEGGVNGRLPAWTRVEDDRWLAGFTFEAQDHLDEDGLLRMALVRTDRDGVRSAWPRPMLPGQTEPGRIAVDVAGWSPVGD